MDSLFKQRTTLYQTSNYKVKDFILNEVEIFLCEYKCKIVCSGKLKIIVFENVALTIFDICEKINEFSVLFEKCIFSSFILIKILVNNVLKFYMMDWNF